MIISEMINKLTEIKLKHGDVKCVTPGFDEAGFDDVDTMKIIKVLESQSIIESWIYKYSASSDDTAETVLLINF